VTTNYAVFENYGCNNERLISEWDSYDNAYCAYKELYTDSEADELGVEIVKWDGEN